MKKINTKKLSLNKAVKFDPKFILIRSGKLNNLGISLEYDNNPSKKFPVLFFTPDMSNKMNHYHIDLNAKQVKVLRDWLDDFEKNRKKTK